jgi:hypothetical protein
VTIPALLGYRPRFAHLLVGPWPRGQMLAYQHTTSAAWTASELTPERAESLSGDERLLVASGIGFVWLREIERVHRRARLQVGVHGPVDDDRARLLLAAARDVAFHDLGLHRLFGWVWPDGPTHRGYGVRPELLQEMGFCCEIDLSDCDALPPLQIWAILARDC